MHHWGRALGFLCLALAMGCENRVNTTRQCLGSGGTTKTYSGYTFDIDEGPALLVGGNCEVILDHCVIHAPEGIRAQERAVVRILGGTLVARGAAVIASDAARVEFDGTAVTGTIERTDSATITGLPPR